jgi:hypothetical protein
MKIIYQYDHRFEPDALLLEITSHKVHALVDNLTALADYSDPPRTGRIDANCVRYISVDFFDDPAAFEVHTMQPCFAEMGYTDGGHDEYAIYEVVTRDEAIINDTEYNETLGNIEDYKVGEINSNYSKLGDSRYYYRAL